MNRPDSSLSTGHPGADAVERAVFLLCLGIFAGGALVVAARATPVEWPELVKLMACLTLAAAMAGIWITNRIEDVPARSFASSCARWLARLQDGLMPGAGVISMLERSGGGRNALMLAVEAMAGSDRDLSRAIDRSRTGIQSAAEVLDQVANQTRAVAGAVRMTTAELSAMHTISSSLAEAARTAQGGLQALSTRTAPLADLADHLHQQLASMAREVASLPSCQAKVEPAVQAIRTVAESATVTLDAMLSTLADLKSAAAGSAAQVGQIAGLVLDQHSENEALSRSIHAQGTEVTALLRQIEAVRPALENARTCSEEVEAIEATRRRAACVVWQDAATIPGRAETIALLLKDFPDFSRAGSRRLDPLDAANL